MPSKGQRGSYLPPRLYSLMHPYGALCEGVNCNTGTDQTTSTCMNGCIPQDLCVTGKGFNLAYECCNGSSVGSTKCLNGSGIQVCQTGTCPGKCCKNGTQTILS